MIEFAHAAGEAAQQPSFFQNFGPLILIMVAAYFLLIRPMGKQKREAEKLMSELEKNTEVILANGIVGKITKVGEQFLTVEIAPNTEIHVQRHANMVARKLEKGSLAKIAKGMSLQPESATPAKAEKKQDKKGEKQAKKSVENEKEIETTESPAVVETPSTVESAQTDTLVESVSEDASSDTAEKEAK